MEEGFRGEEVSVHACGHKERVEGWGERGGEEPVQSQAARAAGAAVWTEGEVQEWEGKEVSAFSKLTVLLLWTYVEVGPLVVILAWQCNYTVRGAKNSPLLHSFELLSVGKLRQLTRQCNKPAALSVNPIKSDTEQAGWCSGLTLYAPATASLPRPARSLAHVEDEISTWHI
eukprot:355447-Chlamydomonas_euryale.AAC.4